MNSYYMGIDVSKGYADFVIIDELKQPVVKNFQLDDTSDGHKRLHGIVSGFLAEHPDASLCAAVESTGGYENNWYNVLLGYRVSMNIKTARLNPKGVLHNSKADLKRNKTDKISAQSVAEYLIAHPEKVIYQSEDRLVGIRKQWGFIKILTKQCTQLQNQLQSLLYTTFPEILTFCREGFPDWVFKLLLEYPTAEKMKHGRVKTVAKIPYVSPERATALIDSAKQSVASQTDEFSARLVSATVAQILHLNKTIDLQKKQMAEQCVDIEEIKLLETVSGIGNASAVGLYLEIGDISRFQSAKKLSSFWGVHPVYKKSGDNEGSFKMSKQGRVNPRRILFTVTLTAIVHNPVISRLYKYHVEKGRNKMDAIGICMHKLTRIIYGMLKNKTAFDPEIDNANRNRSLPNIAAEPKKTKDRRFQDYDSTAPISKRQNKKRLELKLPHNANNGTKSGVNAPVPVKVIISKILESL